MDRYQQSYEEALEVTSENEAKWEKYKKELTETKASLKEFVRSHSLDIMVPMGKKAFVRGKLQHTNEVTVCHGADIFSDVSTSQAIDILEHRMSLCDERLNALEKERKLFTQKLELPDDAFESADGREIIEEYHEAEEAAWRRKHTDSVRRLKQKEAEERQKEVRVERNVHELLDDFELIEELAEELDGLDVNYDDDTLMKMLRGELKLPEDKKRVAHSVQEVETRTSVKRPPEINNNDLIAQNNQEIVELLKTYRCKIKEVLKNVKKDDERNINLFLDLIELKDDIEDDIRKMNDDEEYSESDERDSDDETETASIEVKPEETKRKVRFSTSLEDVKLIESKSELYENGCEDGNHTIHIHFQHSDAKFDGSGDNSNDVACPADILRKFHKVESPAPAAARKSILKIKGSEPKALEVPEVKKIFHSDVQVIGDVVEHQKDLKLSENVVHIMTKDDAPKKVSKFKQMRLKS